LTDELAALDASAQAELVRRGELHPRELVAAAIERLERLDPQLNAVIHRDFDRALRMADAIDPAGRAPFPGVPMLMKDLGGAEAGQPCHSGMQLLKDAGWVEREDSYLTQQMRAAGLVSLGRTNTPELALLPVTEPLAYGPTRNPWSLEHSPGGSSGGAAAAVAAGIVPVAHASDGGGSIRGPASMCGLYGLKPTRARCSFGPQRGERWSGLSCEFMLTRSVRDAARLLEALSGAMPGDPYRAPAAARPFVHALSAPPKGLRIGLLAAGVRGISVHADATLATERVGALLEQLGHHVEQRHPEALEDQNSAVHWIRIVIAHVARALHVYGEALGKPVTADAVEPLTWALAERGREQSAPQLLESIELMHDLGRRVATFVEDFDLLLTPTLAAPPPRIGQVRSTRDDPFGAYREAPAYSVFTLPFNMSGQPAVSLPAGLDANGLPVGVQLVAACGREDLLLGASAQLEAALQWSQQRPHVFG
jgi:amidase